MVFFRLRRGRRALPGRPKTTYAGSSWAWAPGELGQLEIGYVRIICTLLALAGLSAGSIVIGHHSDAGYDRDTVVAFEGVVTSYSFRNPHIAILVETENENGETIEWDIETGSTPIMIRSGWTPDLISEGDTVTIRAHPERSGRLRAILNTMQTTDGQLWYQVEEDPVDTVAASSLDGVWRGLSTFSLRRGMNQVPLTPAAEAARAEFDYFTQTPVRDCVARPHPHGAKHRQKANRENHPRISHQQPRSARRSNTSLTGKARS